MIMKNLYKILVMAVLAATFNSCEEDLVIFATDGFIQLENDAAVSVTENSGTTVTVTAILGAPQSTAINVTFDVSGSAAASRYTLSPGPSVTIPAGETSASISITPIDNDDIDGDADVTLTLSSSSGLPVGIGGEAVNSVSKTITIVDDNVPCNDYVLTINTDTYGEETFWDILDSNGMTVASDGLGVYPNSGIASNSTETFNVSLEDGCYTLRVFDYWGDNGPTFTLACDALMPVSDTDGLAGIAGLDANTVPAPGFRNGGTPPDYVGYAEAFDFCVNQ